MSVSPVILLADRGFHRASFLAWWERHDFLDYVVRLKKGTCISEADGGGRWKLGEEELKPGELRFLKGVRYGLYHGGPRELWINLALCWKVSKSRERNPRRKQPGEPWYLARSLDDPKSAASRGTGKEDGSGRALKMPRVAWDWRGSRLAAPNV